MANAFPQLQEAYELIESGDLQSARQLLDDIRSENENNPDFYWVYAHAVEDENEGIAALDRVRQLAPNYPGLQNLSEELGLTTAPQALHPASSPPSTSDVEEFYGGNDDFESQPRERSGNGLMPLVVITGIVIAVVLVALFLLSNLLGGNGGDTAGTQVVAETQIPTFDSSSFDETATSLVESLATSDETATSESEAIATDEPVPTDEPATEVPTDEPTDTPATNEPTDEPATEASTDEPTDEPATDEPATEVPTDTPEPENTDPFTDVYSALEASGVPEEGIILDETDSFGDTYIVTTCSALGPVATANILNIMDDLQSVADDLDEAAEGFAFDITDCSTDTVRLTLGFDRATADSYWSGEIGQAELQQALQRVN